MDIGVCILPPAASLQDVMRRMAETGIVLVVEDGRLIGTMTDGDVRRAILAGRPLEGPVGELLGDTQIRPRSKPVTAPVGTPRARLSQLMRDRGVRHVPIVDGDNRPVDLVRIEDVLPDDAADLPRTAIIMAGGEGRRLLPLTRDVPKPMLPVNGQPLLERIVTQLRQGGITHILLAVRYLAEVIEEHFGDGSRFGVTITYAHEGRPMGTGGALSLQPRPDGPVLIMNGDILTDVSLEGLFHFHVEHDAAVTLGVRRLEIRPPYGIVDVEGARVVDLREKPTLHYFANAGLYLLAPSVWDFITPDTIFDMPDLVQRVMAAGRTVVSFPIGEEWVDIGEHDAYGRAGGTATAVEGA